jgi:DNA-binding response OmpR family regulator
MKRRRKLNCIQQNGGKLDAALEASGTALGSHEAEFRVEVLHHPDHEPKHIHAKAHDTLLEVMDHAARKLDVKLLPDAHAPLNHLRGKDIRLTPKEFDVLQYLIATPNVAIPHGRILQAVWGPDYGNEIEYLHVFINQLRKKIEKEPSKPKFILTEPWFGYRFNLSKK